MKNEPRQIVNSRDVRAKAYARNSEAEEVPTINAGYRALSSLQLSNNAHIVNSLFSKPIFGIGEGPTSPIDESTVVTIEELNVNDPKYNLLYNKTVDIHSQNELVVNTLDPDKTSTPTHPQPRVNNEILKLGDNISQ